MIQRLSAKIVQVLIINAQIDTDSEQKEVYIYGMECFINTVVPVIVLFIWALCVECIIETFIWIVSFTLLRKFTGGYHASSQLKCILGSILLGIINTLVARYIYIPVIGIIGIYVFCLAISILLCPIASEKKVLSHKEQTRYKVWSVITIIVYGVLTLVTPKNVGNSLICAVGIAVLLAVVQVVKRAHYNEDLM